MAGAKIPLTFRIFKGEQLVREETLTQPVIKVGKLSSSHLRLDDESVSRMHAVIEVTGPGDISIIDLGSTKGTVVNGQKVNKAKLQSGDINAVLSSGDGGAGRGLWKYLRYFSAVSYAAPLSFTSISLDAWNKLDESERAAFEAAARETYERQWTVLQSRVAKNYARMRENGVTIDENPPTDVMAELRKAGTAPSARWLAQTPPDVQAAMNTYLRTLTP